MGRAGLVKHALTLIVLGLKSRNEIHRMVSEEQEMGYKAGWTEFERFMSQNRSRWERR